MANRFKQAAPKAKKLYKTGRYKTFAAAMAAALKKTAPKKRKKSIGRKPARKKATRRRSRRVGVVPVNASSYRVPVISGIGRVSAGKLKSELKKRLVTKIDAAVVRKYHATKKTAKRKIQKSINAAKVELRKLIS